MRKTATSTIFPTFFLAGIILLLPGFPGTSLADIYRWEDESGGIHYTDDIGNIPEKFRGRRKPILKSPPEAGRPSLSTMEAPPRPTNVFPLSPPEGIAPEEIPPRGEDVTGQAEQLRAKISAKERFIEGVDRKRSQILNPLGNRFVSPEDLELYGKYKEELPQDRERLREISPSNP